MPVEPEPEINKIIADSKFTPYYTTAAIGETVKFRLTATVTGTTASKLKAYTIVDTMSDGLTFGEVTSVKLTGDGLDTEKLLPELYTVAKTDTGFEVSLSQGVLAKDAFYSYTNVVVDCTAKLNKDAVIGPDGNPNEDSLKWTKADGTEKTKEGNEVIVYTFEIDVNKVDADSDEAVKGCSFELYKSEEDAKKGEGAIAKSESDDEGLAPFIGLDKGEYFVKETKAAEGYNLNTKPYKVTIKPEFDENGKLTGPDDGIFSTTIENTRPDEVKTGGYAGTICFGLIGAAFLSAAGFLFFFAFRRKTFAEK
jgi:fimbrial isopeptide formation D2 family protein